MMTFAPFAMMMNQQQKIASRCRECRVRAQLSIEEASKRTRFTIERLLAFENGDECPSFNDWGVLAKVYRMKTVDIVRGLY